MNTEGWLYRPLNLPFKWENGGQQYVLSGWNNKRRGLTNRKEKESDTKAIEKRKVGVDLMFFPLKSQHASVWYVLLEQRIIIKKNEVIVHYMLVTVTHIEISEVMV